MAIQGFGYTVIDYGSAWELDRKLTRLVQAGYSHAEVRPEGWQVWQEGQNSRCDWFDGLSRCCRFQPYPKRDLLTNRWEQSTLTGYLEWPAIVGNASFNNGF